MLLANERDEIGFSESWRGSAYYAYRIPIGKGKLGMGLQGTVRYMGVDWSQADPAQLNDQELPVGDQGKYFPNFGVGLFYNTDNWYVGASVPHLLTNSLDFVGGTTTAVEIARERRHVYMMGGVSLPLGEKVRISPNLLMKYVQNAPFDMDVNLSFIFFNRLLVGATYRLGDSVEAFVKRMEDRAVSAKSAGTHPAARVTAPVYRNGVPLGAYNQIAAEAERKYPYN